MKYCLLLIGFYIRVVPIVAQSLTITSPVLLATPLLNESSGIVYTNGALWTHNDSGNQPALYKIDESNGSVLQTVNITNATNTDWEDITADAQYIYISGISEITQMASALTCAFIALVNPTLHPLQR